MSKASSISRKKWAELLTQISWVDASFLGFPLALSRVCIIHPHLSAHRASSDT